MFSIVTWNINSIRPRLHHLINFLKKYNPTIVCLQETKVIDELFPSMEIEELDYHIALKGQKTYNGVAILSKYPLDDITTELAGDKNDEQARYIEAVISMPDKAIRVVSVYIPNGQSLESDKFTYKMNFYDRLNKHAQQLIKYEELLVIAGDYNVAPQAQDVYDPDNLDGTICFHEKEREKFFELEHLGLYDAYRQLHPQTQDFSWWDYRGDGFRYDKGMRIDHLLLSSEASDKLSECKIIRSEREKEKPSDHAPVMATFDIVNYNL